MFCSCSAASNTSQQTKGRPVLRPPFRHNVCQVSGFGPNRAFAEADTLQGDRRVRGIQPRAWHLGGATRRSDGDSRLFRSWPSRKKPFFAIGAADRRGAHMRTELYHAVAPGSRRRNSARCQGFLTLERYSHVTEPQGRLLPYGRFDLEPDSDDNSAGRGSSGLRQRLRHASSRSCNAWAAGCLVDSLAAAPPRSPRKSPLATRPAIKIPPRKVCLRFNVMSVPWCRRPARCGRLFLRG